MTPDALTGGFAEASIDAARAFRAILNALARPGTVEALAGAAPPPPMSHAAGIVLLTLADGTTPVHLAPSHDCAAVRDWLTFHCGAPFVCAEKAVFALGAWDRLQPLSRFPIGSSEYPDRAATLIVEVEALGPPNARLTGPGIAGEARARLPDVTAIEGNNAMFPLGCDFIFTSGVKMMALPRSTRVEAL